MKQETKLCKDCKHYSKYDNVSSTRSNVCVHKQALLHYDPVNGYHRYSVCAYMRQSSCGLSAVLFEPRVSIIKQIIKQVKQWYANKTTR